MKRKEQLKAKPLFRDFEIRQDSIDEAARTVELSFSSETLVERWFGFEVLDHKKKSVRTERFKKGTANLLMDHNPQDVVGVIESVRIDSKLKMGFVTARFGNSARAEEIWNDVKDGIRKSVSVGYRIFEAITETSKKDGPDTVRVTDWEPLEVSIVSIPADAAVGIKRAEGLDENELTITREIGMHKCKLCKRDVDGIDSSGHCSECADAVRAAAAPASAQTVTPAAPAAPTQVRTEPVSQADIDAVTAAAGKGETERIREIQAQADLYRDMDGVVDEATRLIKEGKKVDEMRQFILTKVGKPGKVSMRDIGMTAKDEKRYSLVKAITAQGQLTERGFEHEVSMAIATELKERGMNKHHKGILIPYDAFGKREQSKGVDSAGGYLVGTDHRGDMFIELLRNKALLMAMGAQSMTGLVGDIDIPKHSGGATFYWITEGNDTTASDNTFAQVTMSPNTVSGKVAMTRRLLLQSDPSIDGIVRDDLLRGLAIELDRVGIEGNTSNNEPEGILNTTGIGLVVGGTDGAAMTWPNVVGLETEVAADNADMGTLGYLINAKTRGLLKTTEKSANTGLFLMGEGRDNAGFDTLNGYRAGVSNNMPSDLTKGSGTGLSAAIFGNFNDFMYGFWGAVDLTADPYTNADSGGLIIRIFQDLDTAVRHPESFSAMKDIIT